jgi:hypothetical protein
VTTITRSTIVHRYLTGSIEFFQARQGARPENNVRGSKISSIRIGARRAYKHNKHLPELRTPLSITCTLSRVIGSVSHDSLVPKIARYRGKILPMFSSCAAHHSCLSRSSRPSSPSSNIRPKTNRNFSSLPWVVSLYQTQAFHCAKQANSLMSYISVHLDDFLQLRRLYSVFNTRSGIAIQRDLSFASHPPLSIAAITRPAPVTHCTSLVAAHLCAHPPAPL